MKRNRRWLSVLTAVVCLVAHADALRPLSLQFKNTVAKSLPPVTTTTTTTTLPPSSTTEASAEQVVEAEEVPSEKQSVNQTTSRTLTGIPQVDYVWDPNLPRELNGYNLSDYPFHSLVPPENEINFKCDGLHDGFYASIEHKCQIYHHCIYGIRHDFLCANYTAFDQRTFICHFVSEVDCKNSEKYFYRNDALYKATTTTTIKPPPTTTTLPPPIAPAAQGKRFRRPFRRRRPVDYYYDEEYDDDYYEERVNRRQKNRPRPRRPDYDDYDDDTYDKRPYNRDRKRGGANSDDTYEREADRPAKRPNDRPGKRPADRPVERPVERPAERPIDDPAERPRPRKRPADSKRYNDEEDEERIPPPRKSAKRRRPVDDYEDEDVSPNVGGGRRFKTNDRRPAYPKSEEDKYAEDDRDLQPASGGRRRKGGRRPVANDEEDDVNDRPLRRDPPAEEPAYNNRDSDQAAVVTKVRSSGASSVYERPRAPPRIPPPVPVNERKKFEYATTKKTTTPSSRPDDYYYDDYEDVKSPKKPSNYDKYSGSSSSSNSGRDPVDFDRPLPVKEDPKTRYETVANGPTYSDSYEENSRPRASADRGHTKHTHSRNVPSRDAGIRKPPEPPTTTTTAKPIRPHYNYEDTASSNKEHDVSPKRTPSYDNGYNYDSRDNRDNSRPVVRVIKRPFLPSRGGSPYLPRGLQPVGVAQKPLPTESTPIDMGSTVSGVRLLEHGPPILRTNIDPDDYPPPRQGPRTTQQPQIEQERAALEKLYESEYDVTLNDALNPTLKPITRGLHTGFPSQPNTFASRFAPVSSAYSFQDSIFASTDSKRAAAAPAQTSSSSVGLARTAQSRPEHTYYDYDY